MVSIAQTQAARQGGEVVYGVPEGHDARIIAQKAREIMAQDKVLVHVAMDDARMAALAEFLVFFAPDIKVLSFPAWDCLPYDRVSPHGDIVAARVAALTQMMWWEKESERYPRIVLTSVNAAIQRVMPRSILREASFQAKAGQRIDLDKLQMFLTQNGYSRTETVRDFVRMAFKAVDIELDFRGTGVEEQAVDRRSGKTVVRINPKFYRPAEVDLLIGNPAKAREELGWQAHTSLEALCQMMVEADVRRVASGFSF